MSKQNSGITIYLGADHGGFKLKEMIKQFLIDQGRQVVDVGADQLNPKDDYPDIAEKVSKAVAAEERSVGLLFCRSGGGVTVAANKVDGIRAVEARDVKSAKHAKTDNNANIIALGADWMTLEQAKQIAAAFLDTKFNGEKRHQRRIKKIEKIEQEF